LIPRDRENSLRRATFRSPRQDGMTVSTESTAICGKGRICPLMGNNPPRLGDREALFLVEHFDRGHPGHAGSGKAPRVQEEEMEMSQRNRIVLATVALVAALALVAPAPSRAAGLPWNLPLPAVDRLERAWDQLARFLAGGDPRTTVRREKEGGAVDPNGGKTGVSPQVPTASSPQAHVGGD
jgi:hypothetical protein